MQAKEEQSLHLQQLPKDQYYVVYGVSRMRMGFGYRVALTLERHDYPFVVVHPEAEEIGNWSIVPNLSSLSHKPDAAILCSPPEAATNILMDLLRAGVTRVYAWKGSVDPVSTAFALAHGMNLTVDCPILHVQGAGFPHNLHRGLIRLFGGNDQVESPPSPPAMAP